MRTGLCQYSAMITSRTAGDPQVRASIWGLYGVVAGPAPWHGSASLRGTASRSKRPEEERERSIVRGLLQYLAPKAARRDVQLNRYNAAASPLAASCFPNASRARRDSSEVLSERVGTVLIITNIPFHIARRRIHTSKHSNHGLLTKRQPHALHPQQSRSRQIRRPRRHRVRATLDQSPKNNSPNKS
jgi:hypothetical protein